MRSFFRRLQYKELFLVGFYISFIGITLIAALVDAMIGNRPHALLDVIFALIASLFFLHFIRARDTRFAARAILWTATTIVFIFLVHSGFGISMMFTLLLPVVAFILMPPREIIRNMTMFYLILAALLLYGYRHYDTHPMLHSAEMMSAYFIASLFVIAFGVFYNYAIEASHRRLEKANREKEILLKEIHHRIKNNLNIVSSILGLQKLEIDHPDIDRVIEQNRLRIQSIALAHEILYRSDDLEGVDFADYMRRLIAQILHAGGREKVAVTIGGAGCVFTLEQMIRLGIIVNELVTNSVKYALQGSGGAIFLTLECRDKRCYLEYADSGNTPEEPCSADTLGISLVRLTVEQMHGSLQIDPGYRYHMEFPA